eukprot:TRINITY_DN27137_c0_g1_i1.p1 TRINITY_DN27137_c0_g1~~TRINITY_DN27137_c0_g1_i1.p1  ORF type:complete len:426 (+),score=122.74 TRINITY_DN27137_c0_g1_i1:216-1493(+)
MGSALPKPCMSVVMERKANPLFRCGMAELNGHREAMEDAHLIHLRQDWGFFGVFDGHGGAECSAYVAKALSDELEAHGRPADDAAVKALVVKVDAEWLQLSPTSGSTATMCTARPKDGEDKMLLHVINAGDSRVLLGRRDGSIVDGGGTDQGLTVDHKPDLDVETERITRCGSKVIKMPQPEAPARVDGELAVSRGFGDKKFKQPIQGGGPEDCPVTVVPDQFHFECDKTDFVLLVCDGVSEGNFSNAEAVKMVADQLKEHNDPAEAARQICYESVNKNSKDNVTCMVLLFDTDSSMKQGVEFVPGPLPKELNQKFLNCWTIMAKRGGVEFEEALEMRSERLQAEIQAEKDDEKKMLLQEELEGIGGPVPAGEKGSPERQKWRTYAATAVHERAAQAVSGGVDSQLDMLIQFMKNRESQAARGSV